MSSISKHLQRAVIASEDAEFENWAATFEPTRSIMYFVGVGGDTAFQPQVSLLPLTSFDLGDDLPDLRPVPVPQLTNPSFITYAQAVVPQTAP